MSGTPRTGIIGGSGLYSLTETGSEFRDVDTPFADQPVRLYLEQPEQSPVWFLPRHGKTHALPPHRIPYRAQMWALREAGVSRVIAINAVGGISPENPPGQLVTPDQIIDYSWGREHTYFDGLSALEDHVDFTEPYDEVLRQALVKACREKGYAVTEKAVYACTQGPRLETRAEIRRFARDGCDIIGMTGMPEAALARELGLPYASLALVVNQAAGLQAGEISAGQIRKNLQEGIDRIRQVLLVLLENLPE